jgi:arylsulfatase A-like enzyme
MDVRDATHCQTLAKRVDLSDRRISRRHFLAGTAALAATPSPAEQRLPNIVFITLDDCPSVVHIRDKFSVRVTTPNFNRLMGQGVTFTNAFASTAVCNPSRTAIISGMNPYQTGVRGNGQPWFDYVDPRVTWPGILSRRGWRVFVFGKVTHNDGRPSPWITSGVAVKAMSNEDQATVDLALREMQAPGPWVVMAGLHKPHAPFDAPSHFPLADIEPLDWDGETMPPHIAQDQRTLFAELEAAGRVDDFIKDVLDNIAAADVYLGQFLDGIRLLPRPPIVILTSDHGYHLGEQDAFSKFTLWDSAGRAPLIVSAPGALAGARHESVVSLLDIAPTVLDLVGEDIPTRFDGKSLASMLHDASLKRTDGALTTMGNSVSLRLNRYRITRYHTGEVELFDYAEDPEETNNLADERPALRADLLGELDQRVARWRS